LGDFNNYITEVDTDTFTVTASGKLELKSVKPEALLSTLGNLTNLNGYNELDPTTIVEEINKIYNMLTWQDMPKD
jgi:hypothetical protein